MRKLRATGAPSEALLATVPVVAAMTRALSLSMLTTPAHFTEPSITDSFCSSTSMTLSTDSVPRAIVTLLAVAVIFGVVNAVLRPIIKTIGCGLYVLTLGLVAIVVNGLLFLLTSWIAGELDLPFHVDGFFGSTPEMLVRLERGLVTSRVLAGTIRRTGDDEHDLALAASLARSSEIGESV